MIWPWLAPLVAFLIGSIPFGLLIAKAKGVDIRAHGSGNIGATNVLRTIGKGAGITCLFLDALKGFVPVVVTVNLVRYGDHMPGIHFAFLSQLTAPLAPDAQGTVQLIHVFSGVAAILGHNYSPWLGFRGGKGIATTAGVLGALMPAAVVILILIWAVVTFSTRYVSLGSIAAGIALPLLTHWGARFHHVDGDKAKPTLWEAGTWNKPLFFFALFAGLMAIWKHRSNIKRLVEGTEHKLGSRKNADA